jgi:hypothetical protein
MSLKSFIFQFGLNKMRREKTQISKMQIAGMQKGR